MLACVLGSKEKGGKVTYVNASTVQSRHGVGGVSSIAIFDEKLIYLGNLQRCCLEGIDCAKASSNALHSRIDRRHVQLKTLVAKQDSDSNVSLKIGRALSSMLGFLSMLTSSQRNNAPSGVHNSQLFQGLLGIAKVGEAHHKSASGVEVGEVRPLDTLKFTTLFDIRHVTKDESEGVNLH